MYESQVANKAGQDQLEAVAIEIEDWRRNKKSRVEKIPESLLREAQKLSEHLGASVVRRKLGITKAQMDKLDSLSKPELDTSSESNFMQLVPAGTGEKPTEQSGLTIDISTPNGIKISLSGLAHNDPLALIATLIEG